MGINYGKLWYNNNNNSNSNNNSQNKPATIHGDLLTPFSSRSSWIDITTKGLKNSFVNSFISYQVKANEYRIKIIEVYIHLRKSYVFAINILVHVCTA